MGCCHYVAEDGGDSAFTVDVSMITFGPGCLREAGDRARSLGLGRVALMTDKGVLSLGHAERVRESLASEGIDVALYDEVKVEPTDRSFQDATAFARNAKVDGFVSVGGGSVIDTTKAANLYASHPAEFLTYVNAPIGDGAAIPGTLKPHIACPTTSGTGSECTGIAIFDLLARQVKTGIVGKALKPTQALIDPLTCRTMPVNVVAASAFDVLSHALESYTARPYTRRRAPQRPSARPMSQGANPWSDMGCREALRLIGRYMERGVADASDDEARGQLMWAATLAGIAFGNAGCHAPHGMSYSVAGLVKGFQPEGYPKDEPIVPHGMSVIVNAPALFRFTSSACPERHVDGARLLGGDLRDAAPEDAGEVVAGQIIRLMKATGMPNGVGAVGYGDGDIPALVEGAYAQRRLMENAPRAISEDELAAIYKDALSYW
jgi:hydroxyacid-oxoacid transhydrogenase